VSALVTSDSSNSQVPSPALISGDCPPDSPTTTFFVAAAARATPGAAVNAKKRANAAGLPGFSRGHALDVDLA